MADSDMEFCLRQEIIELETALLNKDRIISDLRVEILKLAKIINEHINNQKDKGKNVE